MTGTVNIEVEIGPGDVLLERTLAITAATLCKLIRRFEKDPDERRKLALAYGKTIAEMVNDGTWCPDEL